MHLTSIYCTFVTIYVYVVRFPYILPIESYFRPKVTQKLGNMKLSVCVGSGVWDYFVR